MDRLAEIRARLDAATPGPWSLGVHPDGSWSNTVIRYTDVHVPDRVTVAEGVVHPDDADLIAHAPNDIAWLLAEVERLRTENGTELLPDESVAQCVTKLER